jgi:hypothetical protein
MTFVRSRWLFLRLVGVIYLTAFISLAVQITGLVGEHGILPVADFLARAHDAYGAQAYRLLPTLVWWSHADAFLLLLCWSGAVCSILLIGGLAPVVTTSLLWLLYLSLTIAGQDFLEFQWDALLLETGLLAIVYAPLAWRSRVATDPEPPAVARWVLWMLAFKVTFLSGITKILSRDPTWANLTALTFHYETQPLPAWTSWFAYQMPNQVHYASAAGMFVIELALPWLIFAPPRVAWVRVTAAALMASLQVAIAATGNYGFFNLLTIVLYIGLLDDRTLERLRPAARLGAGELSAQPDRAAKQLSGRIWHRVSSGVAIVIACFSVMAFFHEIDATWKRPGLLAWTWSATALGAVAPLRSINGYGLFRVMTTERPEIVIEVSADGADWKEYGFRWKPGDVTRRPHFVEPHMPRLDWQMWFAALDPRSAQDWLVPLIQRLLEGNEEVARLLGPNPLAAPVRCVRLAYYQYHFTTRDERAATGAWWTRQRLGNLTNAIGPCTQ